MEIPTRRRLIKRRSVFPLPESSRQCFTPTYQTTRSQPLGSRAGSSSPIVCSVSSRPRSSQHPEPPSSSSYLSPPIRNPTHRSQPYPFTTSKYILRTATWDSESESVEEEDMLLDESPVQFTLTPKNAVDTFIEDTTGACEPESRRDNVESIPPPALIKEVCAPKFRRKRNLGLLIPPIATLENEEKAEMMIDSSLENTKLTSIVDTDVIEEDKPSPVPQPVVSVTPVSEVQTLPQSPAVLEDTPAVKLQVTEKDTIFIQEPGVALQSRTSLRLATIAQKGVTPFQPQVPGQIPLIHNGVELPIPIIPADILDGSRKRVSKAELLDMVAASPRISECPIKSVCIFPDCRKVITGLERIKSHYTTKKMHQITTGNPHKCPNVPCQYRTFNTSDMRRHRRPNNRSCPVIRKDDVHDPGVFRQHRYGSQRAT